MSTSEKVSEIYSELPNYIRFGVQFLEPFLICQWSVKVTVFPHTSTSTYWPVYACVMVAGVASTTWYIPSDCDRWSVANHYKQVFSQWEYDHKPTFSQPAKECDTPPIVKVYDY